jgi:glycolate oxidase
MFMQTDATANSSISPHPVVTALVAELGAAQVIGDPTRLLTYESDGFSIAKSAPLAVVLPQNTTQVAQAINIIRAHGLDIVPRGAATGLAGGTASVTPSVQISTARMRQIHQIDLRNRWALVDAGLPNLALTDALAGTHLQFAPDPSSQRAATIGGNVATNAGGVHTLKAGVTVNHILGVEIVLADGSVHVHGGPTGHGIGPDLTGLLCGSEGTLGIITRVWCRLTPRPVAFRTALAVFHDSAQACKTVADIIAAGIIPAAMEMMDGPMIRVVEDAFHYGFPTDAQALLLIEIDGLEAALDAQMDAICTLAKQNHARSVEAGSDPARRTKLWAARKSAFGAIGRISPTYCTQDACVPRSKLPQVITKVAEICNRYQLLITNVFHAGDGNVHPILVFDEHNPAEVRRALEASGEILRYCVSIGGTITGEHGVGIEKLPYMRDMFAPDDLAVMHRIRGALVMNLMFNPYKVLPVDGVEIDVMHPGRRAPQ